MEGTPARTDARSPTMRSGAGAPSAFGLGARQGEPFWTSDSVTVVKAPPERTGGGLAVVEQLLLAGRCRPARHDPDGDEVFYVLDGILDARIGPDCYTLERSGVLFVPRGASVSLRVLTDTVRLLVIAAPAGTGLLHSLVTG